MKVYRSELGEVVVEKCLDHEEILKEVPPRKSLFYNPKDWADCYFVFFTKNGEDVVNGYIIDRSRNEDEALERILRKKIKPSERVIIKSLMLNKQII